MSQLTSRPEHTVVLRTAHSVALVCGLVFSTNGQSQSAQAEDAADLIRQGLAEREAGRHRASLELFRKAAEKAPNEQDAYIKTAETLLQLWDGDRSPSMRTFDGRSLWTAPADFRRHGEPPYRWSALGKPGLPTEPIYDGAYPIEAVEAWQLLKNANRLAPPGYKELKFCSRVLRRCGQPAEAAEYLEQAAKAAPDEPSSLVSQANSFRLMDKPREAIQCYDELLRLEPADTEHRVERAMTFMMLGDLQKTFDELDTIYRKTPANVDVRHKRAMILLAIKREQEAIDELTECLKLDPSPKLLLDRAFANAQIEDFEAELRDAEAYAKQCPGLEAEYVRGAALHHSGRYDEALEITDRLLFARPYSPEFYEARFKVLDALGRHDEASQAKRRAQWLAAWMKIREKVRNEPESLGYWVGAGMIALEGEEWEAAKVCYSKLVELQPDMQPVTDAGMAEAHLGLGEYEQAVAAATQALDKVEALAIDEATPKGRLGKSTIEEAVLVRAEANLALGRLDAAIADFEAKQAFGSGVGRAYRLRAAKSEAAGDKDGAAADRERAALLDPLGGDPSKSP